MSADLTDEQEDKIGEIFQTIFDGNGVFNAQRPADRERWGQALDRMVSELGFTRADANERLYEELTCCDPVAEPA